ncbi:MAG: type III-A CRISPR-associated RAMP protein Csm4 [Methylosarcina sp.]
MQTYCMTFTPLSAFATPLKGDTLFGQLCWAIRNRFGEKRLTELLQGYSEKRPFAVVSDAFPEGYWPLPKLPGSFYRLLESEDRKAVKKRIWLPKESFDAPLAEWLQQSVTSTFIASIIAAELEKTKGVGARPTSRLKALSEKHPQPHNTINRQTNTTGENGFAPYRIEQEWFIPDLRWTIYLLSDERLSAQEFLQCLQDIGNIGFGRDSSTGLGKFKIEAFTSHELPAQQNANACLTLAPCAPQGQGFNPQNSYYQLFTRFGRHGDIAVHQGGKPFKNPVLLAQTAAVFGVEPPVAGFIGQGIGGNGELSKTLRATVQQGYAPVIGIVIAPALRAPLGA